MGCKECRYAGSCPYYWFNSDLRDLLTGYSGKEQEKEFDDIFKEIIRNGEQKCN